MTAQKRKQRGKKISAASPCAEGFAPLLGALRQLIADSRQQVLRAAFVATVRAGLVGGV